MTLSTTIRTFQSFADASGAPALVDVRMGRQVATFACDMLGEVSCNGIGSGLTVRATVKAADAARRAYRLHVEATLGLDWLARNAALYADE